MGKGDSRHETSCDDLEDPCNPGKKTGEIASDASTQSQKTEKQRERCKEKSNKHKGEHESGHQEVVVRSIRISC